jgi:hypothetical protein
MKVFIHHINLYFETIFCEYILGCNEELIKREVEPIEIIGTLSDDSIEFLAPDNAVTIIPRNNHTELKQYLSDSDYIVYRLCDLKDVDHTMYALKILEKTSQIKQHSFILISNALSWTRTKKFQSNENGSQHEPFHEDASVTRRAHSKYQQYLELEKTVRRLHNDQLLRTFIICSGILYGEGEHFFHQFFKVSNWCIEI